MFRNQYDTDITTFSPAGRLHQVTTHTHEQNRTEQTTRQTKAAQGATGRWRHEAMSLLLPFLRLVADSDGGEKIPRAAEDLPCCHS
jgi:hypothetical protein